MLFSKLIVISKTLCSSTAGIALATPIPGGGCNYLRCKVYFTGIGPKWQNVFVGFGVAIVHVKKQVSQVSIKKLFEPYLTIEKQTLRV